MKAMPRILILLTLAVAVAGVLYVKRNQAAPQSADNEHVMAATKETAVAKAPAPGDQTAPPPENAASQRQLPRLVDLGADKCIPCKMMAPILEELETELAGRIDVEFIDVWKDEEAGKAYGVQMIPTQIFYDGAGKERFRHTGFFSKEDILGKWKELGVDVGEAGEAKPTFSRWEPAQPDTRPKDAICYLCDGDIDPKTRAVMKTSEGNVAFCSPHCYLITYASLTDENKSHKNALVTDWGTGELVPVEQATYLYDMDAEGRPLVRAFVDGSAAKQEQEQAGGSILAWGPFVDKETATCCGFCDRPVYPEDASVVRVDGMQTWGCCPMCVLGVAARTQRDIEAVVKDALTGEAVHVKTFEGHVAELEPPTAVAWGGARKDAEGKVRSTGCFKQTFFANEANLKQWVEAHPTATGQMISIEQALAKKMSMTPQQISKACKIGECTPK